MCRVECLFSSQLVPIPIQTAWWTEARVCEQLADGCKMYVKRSGRDSNLRPLGCSTPPRHAFVMMTVPYYKHCPEYYCYCYVSLFIHYLLLFIHSVTDCWYRITERVSSSTSSVATADSVVSAVKPAVRCSIQPKTWSKTRFSIRFSTSLCESATSSRLLESQIWSIGSCGFFIDQWTIETTRPNLTND